MKFIRILLPVILLISMIGCAKHEQEQPLPSENEMGEWLKTLPGVESVEELEDPNFKKYYLVIFKQMLDPKDSNAGTFLQRVFLAHQDFKNPVIFETEGYNAEYCDVQARRNELTQRYKANCVVVEHRYAGESVPEKLDWKYLTCENAAADLHAVRDALGTAYRGSWIATGTSKGGTNSMSYTMYYPNDVAATVAYVGPICNSTSDTRFIDHMQNVATPEMRKKIVDFQRELLIRRDRIQPIFLSEPEKFAISKMDEDEMTPDKIYEMVVVDYAFGVWQNGRSIDEIPEVNATDKEIIDYAKKIELFGSLDPSKSSLENHHGQISIIDYLRERYGYSTKASTTSIVHYQVQVLIELGYPASYVKPLEDLIPNHEASWNKNKIARFMVPEEAKNIQFSDKLFRQMNQWLQTNDPQLICIYGEYDPWTAGAPDKAYFTGKNNMSIYFKEGGVHSSNIEGLAPTDKEQAWAKLDSWVKKAL